MPRTDSRPPKESEEEKLARLVAMYKKREGRLRQWMEQDRQEALAEQEYNRKTKNSKRVLGYRRPQLSKEQRDYKKRETAAWLKWKDSNARYVEKIMNVIAKEESEKEIERRKTDPFDKKLLPFEWKESYKIPKYISDSHLTDPPQGVIFPRQHLSLLNEWERILDEITVKQQDRGSQIPDTEEVLVKKLIPSLFEEKLDTYTDLEDKAFAIMGFPVSVGGSRRVKSSKQVKDIFFEQIRNTKINIPDKVIEKLWKDLSSKGIFISSKGGNTVKRNNRKKYKTKKSRCKKTRRKYH